jgi:hypothetical protein
VSGKIGSAQTSDGVNDVISIADSSWVRPNTDNYTVSAWVYCQSKPSVGRAFFGKRYAPGGGTYNTFQMEITNNGYADFYADSRPGAGYIQVDGSTDLTGAWHYHTWVLSHSNSRTYLKGYVDGSNVANGDIAGDININNAQPFCICAPWTTNGFFAGTLDEIRCIRRANSASWISTEYKNMNDPANFTIFSAEEGNAPAGPTNQAPNAPTGLAPHARQTSTTVSLYAIGSDPDGDSLSLYFYNNTNKAEISHTTISNNTNGSVSWSSLSRGNTYTFYARCYDGTAWGSNSSTCSFTVNSIPVATGFKTENLTDPVHLTNILPYFNWTTTDGDSDTQVSYEIEIGTTNNSNNIWDTGTVSSSLQHAVYAGSTLSRGTLYYVRVRVYDGYEWSNW